MALLEKWTCSRRRVLTFATESCGNVPTDHRPPGGLGVTRATTRSAMSVAAQTNPRPGRHGDPFSMHPYSAGATAPVCPSPLLSRRPRLRNRTIRLDRDSAGRTGGFLNI
ncbi:hypothetical protein AAFF_G00335570 [Aldrovandia affinis]|uniref:Uncharacterized protein n=1 Tax=Aldrovandia affinis TaxID=143900 RepID=A0AAD7SL90_9TELE|nr:hypothetical protein AAFF_G00335570 [Aldrovandia affinis]